MARLTLTLLLLLTVSCRESTSPVMSDSTPDSSDIVSMDGVADAIRFVELPAVQEVFEVSELRLLQDAPDGSGGFACALGEGCFLDPCSGNEECQSGWCVQHLGQGVCSQHCQEECPPGWSCQQVAGSAPDLVFVCVSDYANLCRPCADNDDCTSTGGAADACLDYGSLGNFCGGPCGTKQFCPWGFSCEETATVDGVALTQCVNDAGECPCTASSVARGMTTPCTVASDFGSCEGLRTCTEEGLTECNASVPAAEQCNGNDDDCDGEADEPDLVEGEYIALCDDGNACTDDSCAGEEGCVNEVVDSGSCDDNDPCTVADHCADGTCLGDPVQCDDENPCTDNICTAAGGCEYLPKDAPCDDDNPCTLADFCVDGACLGTAVDCECQNNADCGELEDGNLCNGTLVCDLTKVPYLCVVDVGTLVSCPVPEGVDAICLEPACDPTDGSCSQSPVHGGWACEDGDPCTVGDTCDEGTCVAGEQANCNDGNPCTDDSCTEDAGCLQTPNKALCNDGDVCTVDDQCAAGGCLGGDALDCSDGDICNGIESCDAQVGCLPGEPTVCDDQNLCNGAESCDAKLGCQQGQSLICDDGNDCTDDTCNPEFGCQVNTNESDCDDGNACTSGEACTGGSCDGGELVDCDDGEVCTTDSCHPEIGCLHSLNDSPCDDADICSLGDHCHLGECIANATLVCNDGNSCTDDSCNPKSGCHFAPNTESCDDGNACTIDDSCDAGWCQAGAPAECGADNPCLQANCDPDFGCTTDELPNDSPCDEANPQMRCMDGECICVADCAGKLCGEDGCNSSCGSCLVGSYCEQFQCVPTAAVRFEGEHQTVPKADVEGPRTYSFWVYLEDVQTTQTLLIQKDTPGTPNGGRPVNLAVKEGSLNANLTPQGEAPIVKAASATVEAFTWYHVVWQVSPDLASLWVDGTFAGALELPGANIDNDFDYTVGGAPIISNFGNFMSGWMYNLRVTQGFVYDAPFDACQKDPLDGDSLLVEGTGPVPCDCQQVCAGKSCGDDACGGTCGACGEQEECQSGKCVSLCDPIVYGNAGIGVNNGWNCKTVCNELGGANVDWDSVEEQLEYCHSLHPGAPVIIANPNNGSYPIYEPQGGSVCKVNQDGQKSAYWTGNGGPTGGDQILCKCDLGCDCVPHCGENQFCIDGSCVDVNCPAGFEPVLGGTNGRSWWQSGNCSGTEYIEPPPFQPPWRAASTPLCKATSGSNFQVKSKRTTAQCQSTNATASTIWLEVKSPL